MTFIEKVKVICIHLILIETFIMIYSRGRMRVSGKHRKQKQTFSLDKMAHYCNTRNGINIASYDVMWVCS